MTGVALDVSGWHTVIIWWCVGSVLVAMLFHRFMSGQWSAYTDEQLEEKEDAGEWD